MKLLSVVVIGGLAVACGGTQQAAPVATTAQRSKPTCTTNDYACAMNTLSYFRDEICGCADQQDKGCAQRVNDEKTQWSQHLEEHPITWQFNEAEAKDMEDVGRQLDDCSTRAMTDDAAASSPTPPPAN